MIMEVALGNDFYVSLRNESVLPGGSANEIEILMNFELLMQ